MPIDPAQLPALNAFTGALAVISTVVFVVSRRQSISPGVVLLIGLGYEVFLGLAMGFMDRMFFDFGDPPIRLPFAVMVLLTFPVVVPTTLRRRVLTTMLTVVAIAAGMLLTRAFGKPEPEAFLMHSVPTVVVAGLGLLTWRIVHRLARAVHEAQQLGSYRLVELLGRGGMGEVWRAKHRMLARPAAIKLVRPEILGAGDSEDQQVLLTRFEREAQATATLRSPHTVELYDFGIADDGTFYYVMELLDGLDLESLVKNFGPIPPERAIHLLHQVCDSLGEAHESGLIHRDIKPANIFACRYGRSVDFVKVLDFGLVKTRGERGGDELALTADGVVRGTPGYMAPEQVLGDRPTDARTDIYALGCLAYWLLAGELVFQGTTAMEVMVHHAHSQPVPPSDRTELPISASIDEVILSCLAKDPAERPQSADELSQRLDACSHDVEPWTPERADRWWDTHQP